MSSSAQRGSFGRYLLRRRLAVGGMAEIHLAEMREPGGARRPVVVKRVLPHLAGDAVFIAMFLDEARIAARLHHPNVVQILDLGKDGDEIFLAMEHLHGVDLGEIQTRVFERRMPIPIPVACRMIAAACAGLHYAHDRKDENGQPLGIIHRDVSPANIFVTFDGEAKLLDFGVARAADRLTRTQTGMVKGKHAYMSPEQLQGKPIDRRTDIFALGVVLHEALTGQRLFRRENEQLTFRAILSGRIPKPSSLRAGVAPELDAACLKAMAAQPTERYQDCKAFELALEVATARYGMQATLHDVAAYAIAMFPERAMDRPVVAFDDAEVGAISGSGTSPGAPLTDPSGRTEQADLPVAPVTDPSAVFPPAGAGTFVPLVTDHGVQTEQALVPPMGLTDPGGRTEQALMPPSALTEPGPGRPPPEPPPRPSERASPAPPARAAERARPAPPRPARRRPGRSRGRELRILAIAALASAVVATGVVLVLEALAEPPLPEEPPQPATSVRPDETGATAAAAPSPPSDPTTPGTPLAAEVPAAPAARYPTPPPSAVAALAPAPPSTPPAGEAQAARYPTSNPPPGPIPPPGPTPAPAAATLAAEAELDAAIRLQQAGKCRAALPRLQKAASVDPGLVEAHLRLALCAAELKDPKGAAGYLRRTADLAPADGAAAAAIAWAGDLVAPPRRTGRGPTRADVASSIVRTEVEVRALVRRHSAQKLDFLPRGWEELRARSLERLDRADERAGVQRALLEFRRSLAQRRKQLEG